MLLLLLLRMCHRRLTGNWTGVVLLLNGRGYRCLGAIGGVLLCMLLGLTRLSILCLWAKPAGVSELTLLLLLLWLQWLLLVLLQ